MRSERDSAAARYHDLLDFTGRVFKARKVRNNKTAATIMKLRKIFDNGRTFTVEAHVVEWSDLRKRVVSLTNDFESKSLELQTMP